MDEEETNEGTENANGNSDNGVPTAEEETIVKEAREITEKKLEAEKLKASNLEREEKLLARKEALASLGGGSLAGDRPAKVEETPAEYAKKLEAGNI